MESAIHPQTQQTQQQEDQFEVEYLHKETYAALKSAANGLFQARKLGVVLVVPESVREALIAMHGQEAQELLSLVDGHVAL